MTFHRTEGFFFYFFYVTLSTTAEGTAVFSEPLLVLLWKFLAVTNQWLGEWSQLERPDLLTVKRNHEQSLDTISKRSVSLQKPASQQPSTVHKLHIVSSSAFSADCAADVTLSCGCVGQCSQMNTMAHNLDNFACAVFLFNWWVPFFFLLATCILCLMLNRKLEEFTIRENKTSTQCKNHLVLLKPLYIQNVHAFFWESLALETPRTEVWVQAWGQGNTEKLRNTLSLTLSCQWCWAVSHPPLLRQVFADEALF